MGPVGHRVAVLAGSAAVGALLAAGAGAQEANESTLGGGETLLQRLILGAGQEKVAIDTPQAVTVIDQDEIEEQQPDTVTELAEKVPGVNASGGESMLGQSFSIRGFGPESIGSSQEGRVQVNIDGATKYYESYRMGGLFTDPELYKRVEVLRGPASGTLYGSGMLGGVINFTTKDASDFLEDGDDYALRLKSSFDSNQEGYMLSAILAARMSENAEFLAFGNWRDYGDIVTGNGTELPGTGIEAPSGLLKGTFYLDPAKERVFKASVSHTATDGLSSTAPGGAPLNFPGIPTVVPRVASDTTATISYQDEASDNPWLDLNIVASYSKTRNRQEQFVTADFSYEYYELKVDNTAETSGENWENFFTYGLQTKYHQRRRDNFQNPGTSTSSHPDGDQTVVGAFVQDEFIWNDRFTLITGLRTDWQTLSPAGTLPAGSPNATSVSDWAISPKVAALYELTDTLSVFGSYAYTERLPSVDEEFSYDANDPQGFLDKEKAHTIELGFGQELPAVFTPTDLLGYKVTGFYNDIENLIVRGANSPYVNLGSAEVYGVELEAAYDSDYFFTNAALSFIRGEDPATGSPVDGIAPDELTFTVGGKLPDRYVRFGWDARFVDAQRRVSQAASARAPSEAFSVHDVFVSWKPEEGRLAGLEVQGRVDNIFDEQYQEYLISAGPAKGRTFKLSLAKTF